jgi:hypothetical protein
MSSTTGLLVVAIFALSFSGVQCAGELRQRLPPIPDQVPEQELPIVPDRRAEPGAGLVQFFVPIRQGVRFFVSLCLVGLLKIPIASDFSLPASIIMLLNLFFSLRDFEMNRGHQVQQKFHVWFDSTLLSIVFTMRVAAVLPVFAK